MNLPQGSNPQTAGFTCNTCGIRFVTAELQRQHMKTDWHRYNLKRRVALLPSISSDVFAEKVLELQKLDHDEDEDEYGFHVNSRKHRGEKQLTKKDLKQQARWAERGRSETSGMEQRSHSPASVASTFSEFSLGDSEHLSDFDTGSEPNYSDSADDLDWQDTDDDSEVLTADETDEEPLEILPNYFCFYCGKNNAELEQNVRHMSHTHGLYLPERSYLVDLDGLLTFVNEVISIDNECLTCGFQGKSLESVRQHMTTKGHCKIPYESRDEKLMFSEFYNFDVDEPKSFTRTQSKKVSFQEAATEDDYTTIHVDKDLDSNLELTLPTGHKVGHRSMVRYHRQNLQPRELPEASKTVALVDRRYAPGLDSVQVTKQQREVQRIENRAKSRYERRTKTRRANHQEHFRDVLLGVL